MITKVGSIPGYINFENGAILTDYHEQNCCENHYLDFEHIDIEDFKGLEFDLSGDDFFRRIDGYGIELVPLQGHSVKIPGYGSNNGYYSSNLSLELTLPDGTTRSYDITECQEWN